jgi:ABC-type transport system involved in multi-copper enzyme maturation permease subunit
MSREGLVSPVLTKELKERFRTSRGPLVIFLYVGAVIAITLAFIYLNYRHNPVSFQPERSREIFIMLSMLQLFLIAFVTPGLSAGVISSERERQTLNILLITRLSAASIILSKLISSLAFTVLLVVATIPVYAMVTLYGGIAAKQLAAVFGLYFLNMVFFGSVGVFWSTWIRRTGISTVAAYACIFALVVSTALGAELIDQYLRSQVMIQYQNTAAVTAAAPAHPDMKSYSGPGLDYSPPPVYESPAIVWILRSLNPVIVMISLFESIGWGGGAFWLEPWKIFTIGYAALSICLILLSIYLLPPVRRGLKLTR